MSTYVSRSRLRHRQQIRKKRNKKRKRNFFLVIFTALIVCVVFAAIKSGSEISRKIKYPVEYGEYIMKYSKANKLDPYLVISVIKQESKFIPDARSAYAGGLMQLTEGTAKDCAAALGVDKYDYMDPETNIRFGCYLLRKLLDKYDSVDTALAAYNAGVGNVDSWLKDPAFSYDGKNLYEIPFSETKYYVQKVKQYIAEYKGNVRLE